jgi:dienelactone hydrolase
MRNRYKSMVAAGAAVAALGLGVAAAPRAQAAVNPYERGPAPTQEALEAHAGPFAIAGTAVAASSVTGFGGGVIYYPSDTSTGTFGGVAVAPGYLVPGSTLDWIAQRTATHGFVVILIDTLRPGDGPSMRADELAAALTYLTTASPGAVRDRLDVTRLAVMGHSMGGGGTIEASAANPALKAAVPLTPWDAKKDWSGVRVPTLIFGAENDTTAPPDKHAKVFYDSMTSTPEKAYLELAGVDHRAPVYENATIGEYAVAWLKRFVDDDARYDQFLCPPPAAGGAILEYDDTCPTSWPAAA